MNFLSFFLLSLFSIIGLLIGIILILLAPEEQRPGKKYFQLIQNVIFALILLVFLFYIKLSLIYLVLLLISLIILYFLLLTKVKDKFRTVNYVYFILAFIFFFSFQYNLLFLIESVLVMLIGIPAASLLFKKSKRNYWKVLINGFLFVVISMLLYFITISLF